MATDPELDAILADLAGITAADSVTLVSGSASCAALFDDGEVIASDPNGGELQTDETVVRYREGAITKPAVGGSVTVQWGTATGRADATFLVREARKDPGNPGMIRLSLVAS